MRIHEKTKREMTRSERLTQSLMTSSLTPRSGTVFVKEMAKRRVSGVDQVYAEGELALSRGQVDVAGALFLQLPEDYRKVTQYREQCRIFHALCKIGVAVRPETKALREAIGEVLKEYTTSITVAIYAESLRERGYGAEDVRDVTVDTVDAISEGMQIGHRNKIRSLAERNTSVPVRFCRRAGDAWKSCGSDALDAILRVAQNLRKSED